MATTKLADIINPEVMGPMIGAKVEALCKITPYTKVDTTLQGVPGDTKTTPSWEYIGDAEDVAEGEEVGTVGLKAGSTTFTIKKAMKAVSITQESINSGLGNPVAQAETQLAKAIAQKVDNDVLDAAYTGTTRVAGDTLAVISYNGIVDAVTQFEDEEDGIEKVMLVQAEKNTSGKVEISAENLAEYKKKTLDGSTLKVGDKVNAVEAANQYYLNPILKMEPDSPETEYTEDELPAITIFLKKDTSLDHEWFPKKQIHDLTTAKYYGVAKTNDAKIVLAKFKK